MFRGIGRGRFVILATLSLPAAGCFTNGQCNSVLGILVKLGPTRNISSLTPCEWQAAFADLPTVAAPLGIDLQGYTIPDLSDEEAQAIVDFVHARNIETLDQLINAFETGSITISELPPVLQPLLTAFQ